MSGVQRTLLLDVGNSSAKWQLREGASVLRQGKYCESDSASRDALLTSADNLDHIWVACVASAQSERQLQVLLRDRWDIEPWFARTPARSGALVNSYEDPSRMGVDRWLAMLAVWEREGGQFCLIDVGSALTIDFVQPDGKHSGGYIIPGPTLMERALLMDTDRVRFDEEVGYDLEPGTSTAEAVRHGVALAQAGAVTMALQHVGVPSLPLYYCGGGAEQVMEWVGQGGTWVPDLVMEGLQLMAQSRA